VAGDEGRVPLLDAAGQVADSSLERRVRDVDSVVHDPDRHARAVEAVVLEPCQIRAGGHAARVVPAGEDQVRDLVLGDGVLERLDGQDERLLQERVLPRPRVVRDPGAEPDGEVDALHLLAGEDLDARQRAEPGDERLRVLGGGVRGDEDVHLVLGLDPGELRLQAVGERGDVQDELELAHLPEGAESPPAEVAILRLEAQRRHEAAGELQEPVGVDRPDEFHVAQGRRPQLPEIQAHGGEQGARPIQVVGRPVLQPNSRRDGGLIRPAGLRRRPVGPDQHQGVGIAMEHLGRRVGQQGRARGNGHQSLRHRRRLRGSCRDRARSRLERRSGKLVRRKEQLTKDRGQMRGYRNPSGSLTLPEISRPLSSVLPSSPLIRKASSIG